ncbi:hypothetical protein CDL12_10177 [Handroanthus impetiginosus]|uniref:NAC domain-containing protein n=1 Tax=Handroanthus impetiginosus TaxID=429701 RepID=A0A2G9HI28_9LAMI|nr:hypothetical protein CDL12_10177 [Handroanthus impetiginosus]
MEGKNHECDKIDEVMLPGFRFHPTDEELQKPLSIELIKQLDIYKYDPWDLPKLATTGEKEWYFYCPRDRKYRNSARPNRVTGAGFWKATGTDRPIYSSEGSKCIGLKKSLVFYKGRAGKGVKTDWMMHEFRFPSDTVSSKKYLDKNIPANEAWAICRIFKKVNSTAQRALSHSWINSPIFDTNTSDIMNPINAYNNIHFSSSSITMANKTNSPLHFGFNRNNDMEQSSIASFCMGNKPFPLSVSNEDHLTNPSHTFSSCDQTTSKCAINDASSLLQEMSTSILGDFGKNVDFSVLQEQCTEGMEGNLGHGEQNVGQVDDDQWAKFGHSFNPLSSLGDAWKSNLLWDSSSCPSELYTSYSTNKCYS